MRRHLLRGVSVVAWMAAAAVQAQSDGLPRGCSEMPYVRYEAEAGTMGGGAVLRAALDFDAAKTASEASNRQYVGLSANGSYVQWAVGNQTAAGVTLRYTLPDNATGTGVSGSLGVYVNGVLATTISPGSYWAWTYFVTTDPRNTPGGTRPRMRFDEIHFRLTTALKPGDVLKIMKTNGDAYEYGIDFVEIEPVPDAIAKPAGYVSVTDYGGNGTDSKADSNAFDSAWAAAKSKKTGLYIPAGKFILDRKWNLGDSTGVPIQGAGAWYSELFFSTLATSGGGITTGKNTKGITISHFYMNSALNQRFVVAGQVADYKAFNGPLGSGSSIHHVWITHFETGAWVADYTATVKATTGLDFAYNRVRYTYADGINLSQGTSSCTVRQCDFRSNGDDAMAVWPSNTSGAPECHGNIFHHNTVEFGYRAGGAGMFGGYGHEIHHCIIKDGTDSAGIRFTEDFSGYHFQNNTAGIRIYENTIIGKGTSLDLWGNARGAIEIYGAGIQYLAFTNNDILNSPRHAIQLGGGQNLAFTNTTVATTGLDNFNSPTGAAIYEYGYGGSANFNLLNLAGIEHDPAIIQDNSAYVLTVTNRSLPVATVSAVNVPEGGTAAFGVRLDSQPANTVNVTVAIASGDPDITVQSGASLQFNATNWSANQTVTIAAAEDPDAINGTAVILCTAVGFGSTQVTATELDNDINHPPGAVDDTATTDTGTSVKIAVLSNDSDPESDPLVIQSVTNGTHGTVTQTGTVATYSPDAGFAGADSFTYTASDGRGGNSTASVAVTVWEPCPYEMEICFTGYNGTETLANFPVLVKLGPAQIGFSYSQFASSDGGDLRFRDSARNELKYEIESWDPTGTSYVWVKVPALSKNTSIWAAWGSPKLATKPAYTTDGSVWSEGYAAVYHADEGTATHKDSTANARHGTPLGNTTTVAGMVAGADQFDGSGDAVRLPKTFGLFGGNQSVTVEFWFKADAVAPDTYYGTSPVLFQGRGENAWMLTFGDSVAANSLSIRLNQGGWASPVSAPGIVTGRWYYFSATYTTSGTNNWKGYLDGALVSQGTLTGTVTADTLLNNQYGGSDESGVGVISRWFKGAMDEVRVSNVSRSANWLWASWNTVLANETFATYGAAQEVGARYEFSIAASGGGAVTGSASGECLPGSTVTIAAVPDAYYHWSYWTGNVPALQTNPLTLTMDQNRSVTAVFEPDIAINGVPHWWLAQYGWTSDFDAAAIADADGDGQNALQEYLAGTDPIDSSSVLRIKLEPDPATGGLLISWSSVAGKTYRIDQAADLNGSWTVQAGNIPATPPLNTEKGTLPSGGNIFFRIVVE